MGFVEQLAAADRQTVDHLGEQVQYTPQGGLLETPTGIFDSAYAPIDGGNHTNANGSHPAIFFLLSDLTVDPETDTPAIVIRGTSYQVAEVHKDHQGGVLLVLQKV